MELNVRDFIINNYTEYTGDESFLQPMTERNQIFWQECQKYLDNERQRNGVIGINLKKFAGINEFEPYYIDPKNELIVGFQGDFPLERIMNPFGGMRMVEKSVQAYGEQVPEELKKNFSKYRKTHNDAVFSIYPKDVRACRHSGLLTGLPDAYGRGRIIGDYRRIALYGIDTLIEEKRKDFEQFEKEKFSFKESVMKTREQIADQIKALNQIKTLAESYGCDISKPAQTAQEVIQAIYFGYLAGAKENNGAATSLGRVSTFIDIYIEKDLKAGILTEATAQELIDQFVMKLRFIRHLRTPEYNEMFGGDPTWVTESIGGMNANGKSLVTKTSFRFLHTLYNLGTAPEPNLTILWDEQLPKAFKKYCAKVSIETDAIQYENDSLMRPIYGDDYGIACCVSAMAIGKQSQYFGARCNLAKALLYAINGGRDEITGELIIPNIPSIKPGPLSYLEVYNNYLKVLKEVARIYATANNCIHYCHDKYAYEASQMALHDTYITRFMAYGIAGFSVAVDSLSAIKYALVTPIRNENGLAIDFTIEGDYPKFGNDIDKIDKIGIDLVKNFYSYLSSQHQYNHATPTLSILTITSNVAYGKKTGATPDGRKKGEPFAPGANPMHGRDVSGPLAALNSVAKIPYKYCRDGISHTFSIAPAMLGKEMTNRIENLIAVLDGYFCQGAQHLNVNVLNKEKLLDAYEHPENYPNLTIRVSGYAVLFNKLSREQQLEVIKRTIYNEIQQN